MAHAEGTRFSVSALLTQDEITARIATRRGGGAEALATESTSTPEHLPAVTAGSGLGDMADGVLGGAVAAASAPSASFRFVRPLEQAASDLIDTFQNTDGRFQLGISALDLKMRGIGKGELAYLTGFAHSGKTQLVLQAIINQRHQNVLWFSPDETATQVLAKLFSMISGRDGAEVERHVKGGDHKLIAEIHHVANEALGNLLVIDEVLGLEDMTLALGEAEQYWGGEAAMVGLDYIGLLAHGAEYGDLSSSSKAVKRWVKSVDRSGIVIHQGSRGGSGKGKELSLQSMAYAGEAEATFVLGVRRKTFDESLDSWERQKMAPTLTVQLLKNKRVSGGLGEVDLYLDLTSGLVRELRDDDLGPQVPSRHNAWSDGHEVRALVAEDF